MVVSMLTVAAVSAGAADSSGTTTITVGVINYVINEFDRNRKDREEERRKSLLER